MDASQVETPGGGSCFISVLRDELCRIEHQPPAKKIKITHTHTRLRFAQVGQWSMETVVIAHAEHERVDQPMLGVLWTGYL